MMISQLSDAAVSGVSLVDMINYLIINVFAALATGGAVVVSQYIGHTDREKACRSADQLIGVTFLISLFIAAISVVFRRNILSLLFGKVEDDVMNAALLYFFITAISYPFLALYNSSAAVFRSMGNSKISMWTSVAMNVMNIAGNALLIFVFDMGVAGAAVATVFSRAFAAILLLILVLNKKNYVFVDPKKVFVFDIDKIKRILGVGIPSGFENGVFQLGRVVVVSIITLFDTPQIAANAIANNLDSIGIICGQAMGLAFITVIGQCLGAGDKEQALYYSRRLMKLTYILLDATNIAVLCLLPFLVSLYNRSDEINRLAEILVLIHAGCAIFLWPIAFSLPNVLRAAGDTKYTMAVSISSMVLIRIIAGYFFAVVLDLGAIGIWIGMVLDWIVRSTCFMIRYKKRSWLDRKVI